MATDTWMTRVINILNPEAGARNPYSAAFRRPLQTIILYEANRCILGALPTLRPFQRKLAYLDMMCALLDSLAFLTQDQKDEILWRTGTSKEKMSAETAWKRRKLLFKDLQKIRDGVLPFFTGDNHNEAVDLYIRQQYHLVTGNTDTEAPAQWQHSHNNNIMCYRLYYKGGELDDTFPEINLPKEILIAEERMQASVTDAVGSSSKIGVLATKGSVAGEGEATSDGEVRRLTLQEVRDHLEILKEFEGVIPEEELLSRKRALFRAMPAPPTPDAKKVKGEVEEV